MHKLKISSYAENDLLNIFSYISSENKPAAIKLITRIEDKLADIARFPLAGPMISAMINTASISDDYRYCVVNPYIVFYKIINDEIIVIARILHSKQNYIHILLSDSSDIQDLE